MPYEGSARSPPPNDRPSSDYSLDHDADTIGTRPLLSTKELGKAELNPRRGNQLITVTRHHQALPHICGYVDRELTVLRQRNPLGLHPL